MYIDLMVIGKNHYLPRLVMIAQTISDMAS